MTAVNSQLPLTRRQVQPLVRLRAIDSRPLVVLSGQLDSQPGIWPNERTLEASLLGLQL